MSKMPRRIAGQTATEYAVLAAVLIGALLAMQIYLKRGLSGHLRSAADSIGEQYAPTQTTQQMTTTLTSNTTTTALLKQKQPLPDGKTGDVMETTTTINSETMSRKGSETVGPLERGL